ncbi:MAG: hypothetical protein J0I00_09355 [Burkholderiales bacterium]|uniref:hypothetical protein n=1 Tax=Ottowia sp. TaxID=1898956 RepID=UPI001AD25C2F|nr:hypothetical protein [Ottowia sp.]MBN9405619.1 hypothetical protein [Burkholderiales bacterium]
MSAIATKRANFDLTPEQDEILANLRAALSASSVKDTVLRAAQVTTLLVNEARRGNHLFVGRSAEQATRLAIPELEAALPPTWQWLVQRPHPWRRQLWIKGRKLQASAVWLDAQANGLSAAEAAENWNLPLPAVEEALAYSEAHRALIEAEADEERQRLLAEGIAVGNAPA